MSIGFPNNLGALLNALAQRRRALEPLLQHMAQNTERQQQALESLRQHMARQQRVLEPLVRNARHRQKELLLDTTRAIFAAWLRGLEDNDPAARDRILRVFKVLTIPFRCFGKFLRRVVGGRAKTPGGTYDGRCKIRRGNIGNSNRRAKIVHC